MYLFNQKIWNELFHSFDELNEIELNEIELNEIELNWLLRNGAKRIDG